MRSETRPSTRSLQIMTHSGRITHFSPDSGIGTISTPDDREFLFKVDQVVNAGLIEIPLNADVRFETSTDRVERVEILHSNLLPEGPLEGILADCRPARGFGFIITPSGQRFFVHISEFFPRKNVLPNEGEPVVFEAKQTNKGPEASKVQLLRDLRSDAAKQVATKEFLDAAIIKKADGDFQAARELYERGLKSAPSIQLVLSYAAMERDKGRPRAALDILQRGLEIFKTNGKLHSDAAKIAISLKEHKLAISLCEDGIKFLEPQKGARAELLEIHATACFQTHDFLRAESLFSEVRKSRKSPFIERLYLQSWAKNHSVLAENTLRFFVSCNFALRDVSSPNVTHCIDYLFENRHPSIATTYGLEGFIFVRCFVKQDPTQDDVESTIRHMRDVAKRANISNEAMILVVQDSTMLSRFLVQLADTPNQRPICVVLQSTDVQTKSDQASALFRKRLDEWLFRRNLYAERSPVTGSSFFGRNQVLKEIEGQINIGNHVGIFGLRKTGKTSLLYSLRDRLLQDIVVYVDLQQFGLGVPIPDLCRRLIEETNIEIKRKFGELGPLQRTKSLNSTMAEVMKLMERVRERRKDSRFVLLIDEVERMDPTSPGSLSGLEFFSSLRGTAQQTGSLISIICGADPAINLSGKWATTDNPVFQFYHPIYLPPLQRDECLDMITHLGRGMGVSFQSEALDIIFSETYGHPAITRGLCSKITQEQKERPLVVTPPMVEATASEFSFVEAELLKEILERFSTKPMERTMLEIFIAAGGGVDEGQLLSLVKGGEWDSLRRLLNYSIIVKSGTKYTMSMNLLTRCLRREGI